jgi:hypothetical protein
LFTAYNSHWIVGSFTDQEESFWNKERFEFGGQVLIHGDIEANPFDLLQ